jgi:hypothetical protein
MTARGLLDGLAIISDIMKVVYVNFGKPDPEAA